MRGKQIATRTGNRRGQGEGVDAQLPDAQRREEGRVEKGLAERICFRCFSCDSTCQRYGEDYISRTFNDCIGTA